MPASSSADNEDNLASIGDSPWLKGAQGIDAVNYQRAAQINWWSILQALAVAELAARFDDAVKAWAIHPSHVIFYLAAFLIIVNAWIQMAWINLVSKLPLTIFHTALVLILGMFLILMCKDSMEPSACLRSLSVVILCTIILYRYNRKRYMAMGLEEKRLDQLVTQYVTFLVLAVTASATLWANSHLVWLEWLCGVGFLLISVAGLAIQQRQMSYEAAQRQVPT